MKINITLFIQIANFLGTYAILDKLIFKPTMLILKKRMAEEEAVVKAIGRKEESLYLKGKDKKLHLLNFQKKIRTKYPMPKKAFPSNTFEIAYKRDNEEIERITKKIKKLILEEIPRVR